MRAWPLMIALLSACGGETELEPTYPTRGCAPSHERVGGRCTVKEVLISGGQFLLGAGYCPHGRILDCV
ncbi:MAG: hypothetical protein KF718_01090 [Polyangiaceae bacterium]|nr:hypothetical protein [Polyangiaceae bacterium]